jgi:ubiquinone/menaquinone biosynthesis C-methylase UbiE
VKEALALGYDKRYSEMSVTTDERSVNTKQFTDSFTDILRQLNILNDYRNQSVVVVGVGNGIEGKMLYSDINDLSIIDIAPNSLYQAQQLLPQAKAFQERAEQLTSIPDNVFDLYISLRTYQSTYFDIPVSLQEAKRILKDNGIIIISIACGYLNNENKFVYGLLNPYSGILEDNRPSLFLNIIEQHLIQLKFIILGVKKTQTEIFIYAKNTKQIST